MEKPLENYCFRVGTLVNKIIEDSHYTYYKEDIIHGIHVTYFCIFSN